jgi:hypothetical protein
MPEHQNGKHIGALFLHWMRNLSGSGFVRACVLVFVVRVQVSVVLHVILHVCLHVCLHVFLSWLHCVLVCVVRVQVCLSMSGSACVWEVDKSKREAVRAGDEGGIKKPEGTCPIMQQAGFAPASLLTII